MTLNPTQSYAEIFKMPPTFPPLPGTSEWIPIRSIEEHRAYIYVEKKSKSQGDNHSTRKTSPLIMQYQSYIEHNKIEHERQEKDAFSRKPKKHHVSEPKLKK